MRLIRLRLENFRGVTDSTVEFTDGITVVQGPNEVGKSSIPEAIRLLREAKASSRSREIVAVKPIGRDVGPSAELELSAGPYLLTYRKRWLKAPVTELDVRRPRPEQLSGDQAHERFLAILAENVDLDLLTALGVVQGESLNQPDLARVSALHRALDGSGEQFDPHDQLIDSIEAEYAKYFTPTGRPTGEYRQAIDAVTGPEQEVAALRAGSDELDRFTDEHERSMRALRQVEEELGPARTALAGFEARDAELVALRDLVALTLREREVAERSLIDAVARRTTRTELAADLSRRAAAAQDLRTQIEQLRLDSEPSAQFLTAAQTAAEAARRSLADARAAAALASAAVERRRDSDEHADLTSKVERARAAHRRAVEAQAELAELGVTAETVSRLAALATELDVARRAQDAAAALVKVTPLGSQAVLVDGEPVAAGSVTERAAVNTIRIEVAGVLAVDVSPGTRPAELENAVGAAQQALDAALRAAGVPSVEDARRLADRRVAVEAEGNRASVELAAVLGADELPTLELRLIGLEARLADHSQATESLDTLRERAAVAASAEAAALAADEAAQKALVDRRAERQRADRDAAVLGGALASAEQELAHVQQRLAEAREQIADAALDDAVAAAEAEVARRRAAAEEAEVGLRRTDPDTLAMQLSNARELVASKAADLESIHEELTGLEALLSDRASLGIYDKLADAQARWEAAEAARQRFERRAAAARLLRDTVLRHRDLAQERYVEPFRQRIQRMGRLVFGGDLQVEISTDLKIESRTLGGVTVPFASLSAGAREQLALLGRLACAQLVDPSEGAPLILDDTLGFSDPDRLAGLGVVLNDVGTSAQVIVLTCQPQRFSSVGGAKVVRLS